MIEMAPSPELRFPEFEGDWKPAKAGDAFRNSKKKGEAGLPIWSVTLDRGLVPRDSLERYLAADAADESNLRAEPGDLVYNMMRMWQGAVGVATEECMLSPAYVVLRPRSGIYSKFFDFWFKNPRMLHQLWAYSHGLTNDRLRLYYADFASIPIRLPSYAEQKKIADILDAVSKRISILGEKKLALEEYKRGLIQRIFDQEVRFQTENGGHFPAWKHRRLCEVFEERKERGHPEMELLSVTVREGVKLASEVERAQEASVDRTNYKVVSVGDLAYNSMRMWQGASGVSEYDGIVSPAYTVAIPKPKQVPEFWKYYVKHPDLVGKFRRYSQGLTSDTWSLKFKQFSEISAPIPSESEQRKIATCLEAVDAKIVAVSDTLGALRDFKKGLLQMLYV